ncbi:MAG: HIT domain-containing protein [Candidatus Woesearchaeota archaeon]
MDNCIFCKIAKGEIPSYKVYEDKDFLAFLDITPRNKGHTLVVPKKHFRWVWDVDDTLTKKQGIIVKKIANALKKTFNIDYVVSFIMGNEVPHSHVHLVPRFGNDGHGALIDLKNIKQISKEEMAQIANNISRNI